MSEKTEMAGAALREWKRDLEERCKAHLLEHPEPLSTTRPSASSISVTEFKEDGQHLNVSIHESIGFPGAWAVYVGDQKITTFFGSDSYAKARDMMRDLLKNKK